MGFSQQAYFGPQAQIIMKKANIGTSLVVHWLKLHVPNAGGPGWILSQGTRYHMLQLRVSMPKIKKTPRATTKT